MKEEELLKAGSLRSLTGQTVMRDGTVVWLLHSARQLVSHLEFLETHSSFVDICHYSTPKDIIESMVPAAKWLVELADRVEGLRGETDTSDE
jgi:hypothetical protein